MLPQLGKFWDLLQNKLSNKGLYIASIDGMRLKLQELYNKDKHANKLRMKQLIKDNWRDINGVLHYQRLSYISKIIWIKLISRYDNNLLVGHFDIEKICELVAQKYY